MLPMPRLKAGAFAQPPGVGYQGKFGGLSCCREVKRPRSEGFLKFGPLAGKAEDKPGIGTKRVLLKRRSANIPEGRLPARAGLRAKFRRRNCRYASSMSASGRSCRAAEAGSPASRTRPGGCTSPLTSPSRGRLWLRPATALPPRPEERGFQRGRL
jgi:hypothetical protein